MARVDYFAIEQAIRTQITGHAGVPADLKAFIENDVQYGPDVVPAVYIYLDRRAAPASEQRLAAGTSTGFLLTFTIWCVEWHETLENAAEIRDDLLGKVEIALMSDRTLGSTVDMSWIEGGEFLTGDDNGFLSAASITLTAKVYATV